MSVPRNVRNASEPRRQKGIVFSDFQERVNEVKVVYKSSMKSPPIDVMVWYWPSRFSDDLMARISDNRSDRIASQLGDDGVDYDPVRLNNEIIVSIVKEWDIWDRPENEGGHRIPPAEIVDDLEITFKSLVIEAIQKDMQPTEQRRQRSDVS